jgi:hypothetical protein
VAVEMRSALSTLSPPSFISLRRCLSLVLPVGCGAVSALLALDPSGLCPLAAQLPWPLVLRGTAIGWLSLDLTGRAPYHYVARPSSRSGRCSAGGQAIHARPAADPRPGKAVWR